MGVPVRQELRFLLNAREVRLGSVPPRRTLLEHLRLEQRLMGTKEGCNEGDCGACTVLVGRLREGRLCYEPANACIRLLASVDRCHVVTVEHLASDAGLHPVQQAMVAHAGSQCGFCTPGVVMSLLALRRRTATPSREEAATALQGNLCRCTGYAPILRAAEAVCADRSADRLTVEEGRVAEILAGWQDDARVEIEHPEGRSILPADRDDLLSILAAHPEATVVAGATDVGLWVTKAHAKIAPAVHVSHLDTLRRIEETADSITIGAAASYADLLPAIERRLPWLASYWLRIGGEQIRAAGTIGGNIANGSPIGDTPPPLIALGATLALASREGRREVPLEAFFVEYGRQDLREGEIVDSIRVPTPEDRDWCAAYKLSKRRDEDISTLALGIRLRLERGRVAEARLAFGGMAGVPKRARAAEAALTGQQWSEAAARSAGEVLGADLTPIDDWRGSATYRMAAARNLILRAWHESCGSTEPRLTGPSPIRGAA